MDDVAQARIAIALDRLEAGNVFAMKGVGSGVFEVRLNLGPGYRVYCGKDGETLVMLLSGGTKKRQQADIAEAGLLWQEYKRPKRRM